MRVYFVGSHATGKTTLCRYVSRRYGLPMISEMARAVLAEMETSLDALRTDMDLVAEYQERVFARQVEVERIHQGRFVSDRAFDNLAYAAEHTTVSAEMLGDPAFTEYMRWVNAGVVFFLRPHPSLLREDGTRAGVSWDSVLRIDGMIKLMLEQYRVAYLPIESVSMQERVRAVEFVLARSGLEAVTSRRPSPPLPRVEMQRPLFVDKRMAAVSPEAVGGAVGSALGDEPTAARASSSRVATPTSDDDDAEDSSRGAVVHAAALAETSSATALPGPRGAEEPSKLAAGLSIESWPQSLRQVRDREI
jgi:nicotinamide riboside kinase